MAIGTKELTTDKLAEMDGEELALELKKAKTELFNLRFQAATGSETSSNGRVRAVKRDIARIYTILRERELGIRETPVKVEASATQTTKKSRKKAAEPKAEAEKPAENSAEEAAE